MCKEEKSQRAVAESFALGSSQQKTIKMEGLVWFLFVARRGGCPGLVLQEKGCCLCPLLLVEGEEKKSPLEGSAEEETRRESAPVFPPLCPIRQVCLYEGKGSSGEGRGTGDHQSSCQLLWGSCLGSSPDFQPKKRDQKMVLDPGSGSSALWAQGSRKDIKSPPSLIVKLPPLGNSV